MKRKEVLVLNMDYSYLNFVSVKKCLKLIAKGKVDIVKYSKEFLRTVNGKVFIPLVIKLLKLVRIIYKRKIPFSKKNVIVRDNYKCTYCGVEGTTLTIDHVVPKSKGGKSIFENCVAACKLCNNAKRDVTCSQAKMFPNTKLIAPTINEFIQIKMKRLGVMKIMDELFESIA